MSDPVLSTLRGVYVILELSRRDRSLFQASVRNSEVAKPLFYPPCSKLCPRDAALAKDATYRDSKPGSLRKGS